MQKIFVAHQDANNAGNLFYNIFNGDISSSSNQWQEMAVSGSLMSSSPALVVFNNQIYCFYQGYNNNGTLMYNVYDINSNTWSGEQNVPYTGMSASPSAVVFNNQIYCFHQGHANNGELWYNVFDDYMGWTGDRQVPNTGMSASPSAVVFNNQIYCFHQGHANNGELWYNIFDGNNWVGDQQVSGAYLSESPSAVAWCGNIVCYYQDNGNMFCCYGNNGSQWNGNNGDGSGFSLEGSPCVLNINGNDVYCFYNTNGRLCFALVNSSDYATAVQLPGQSGNVVSYNISSSPAAILF